MSGQNQCRIAFIIPCLNEEGEIEKVVKDCKRHMPEATVYVYDNNSTDKTIDIARKSGAVVCSEPMRGKGHVVRRMFADIDADIYIMTDGDSTYDLSCAPKMVQLLQGENLDMVVGTRQGIKESYPSGHKFGNWAFNCIVRILFSHCFTDIFSGYRVFSRRFVKSFPSLSKGFDIETELSVHSLQMHLPVREVSTPYGARGDQSQSKLNTFRDGFKILWRVLVLFKDAKPLWFFSIVFFLLLGCSLATGIPVIMEYFKTGLVPRFPTAVLSASFMILSFLSLGCGVILDTVSRMRLESKRLNYLRFSPSSKKGT